MLLIKTACNGAHSCTVVVGEHSSGTGFRLGLEVPVSDLVSDMASSISSQVYIDICLVLTSSKSMQLSCTASQARSGRYRTADALSQQAPTSFRPRRLTSIGLAGSHCLTACWRTHALPQKAARRQIHATYPEPETEKERSPLDYPQVSSRLSGFMRQ